MHYYKTTGMIAKTDNDLVSIEDVLMVKKRETAQDFIQFFSGGNNMLYNRHVFRPDTLVFILVKEGTIHLRYNMTDYILKQDCIFFGFDEMPYEVLSTDNLFSFSAMTFTLSYAEYAGLVNLPLYKARLTTGLRPSQQLTPEKSAYIDTMLMGLQMKALRSKETPLYKESLAHGFLSFIYDLSPFVFSWHEGPQRQQRSKELTNKFLEMLDDKYREEKTVKYYARNLGITARHLARVVKESTGKFPHELITQRTIQEAKILLTEVDATISIVADQLQFADQSLFGRFFKRYTGIAPTQYRRKYLNASFL
jgi:AraC family transcriptional activator of pobA